MYLELDLPLVTRQRRITQHITYDKSNLNPFFLFSSYSRGAQLKTKFLPRSILKLRFQLEVLSFTLHGYTYVLYNIRRVCIEKNLTVLSSLYTQYKIFPSLGQAHNTLIHSLLLTILLAQCNTTNSFSAHGKRKRSEWRMHPPTKASWSEHEENLVLSKYL